MTSRAPACEACRKSKLACDHKQPVCTRCKNNNKAGVCIYRASPFKRKRINSPSPVTRTSPLSESSPGPIPSTSPRRNRYPNPGYMGSSSHVAIFNHITPIGDQSPGSVHTTEPPPPTAPRSYPEDSLLNQKGADALKRLLNLYSLRCMKDLVKLWLASGANLALAGALVEECLESIDLPLASLPEDENWHMLYAERLLANSAQPLSFQHNTSFAEFCSQSINHNIRWETLGIFISAVTRATIDIPFFPSLYSDDKGKHALRRLCTRLGDCALEISLSLDSLNDLQLVLQHENFIVHSHVDGDQSYHSWRRLGDVIASIFALGYHETVEPKPGVPPFLQEIRKATFALTYSADKNVALFLGRPPRMSKRFCRFQTPSCPTSQDIWLLTPGDRNDGNGWNLGAKACYRAETRWTTLCAALKEDVMHLQRDQTCGDFMERVSQIQIQAERQWDALPDHFRLKGSLKERTQNWFERDFLAGVRLNHLHVCFLIRLLLLDTPAEPDHSIVEIAEEMLSITIEAILLRGELTNSGTGLIWKVAHYCLPAAGIILLSMLNQRHLPNASRITRPRTVQNLGVLVTELQMGSLIRPTEPNYELLSKAMQTIQSFLDVFHAEAIQGPPVMTPQDQINEDWAGVSNQLSWDFEIGFWQNLADHPSLMNFHSPFPGL